MIRFIIHLIYQLQEKALSYSALLWVKSNGHIFDSKQRNICCSIKRNNSAYWLLWIIFDICRSHWASSGLSPMTKFNKIKILSVKCRYPNDVNEKATLLKFLKNTYNPQEKHFSSGITFFAPQVDVVACMKKAKIYNILSIVGINLQRMRKRINHRRKKSGRKQKQNKLEKERISCAPFCSFEKCFFCPTEAHMKPTKMRISNRVKEIP